LKKTIIILGLLLVAVAFMAAGDKTVKPPNQEQKLRIKVAILEWQLAQEKAAAFVNPTAQKLQSEIEDVRKSLKVPEGWIYDPKEETFKAPAPEHPAPLTKALPATETPQNNPPIQPIAPADPPK
jgi:hypothetical protein